MKKIKKSDLDKLLWRDISIQKLKSGESVFILIFETQQQGEELLKLLKGNAFSIKIFIDPITNHYRLSLLFTNSEYGIHYDTGRTEQDYPPLKWIKDNQIKYITTGIWLNPTPDGHRVAWFRKDFKEINSMPLN